MIRKSTLTVIIIIFFGFSMIVSIPMIYISIGFSPYYIIEYPKVYYYYNNTINPSTIKSIDLNVDVGEIEIKYGPSLVDYCVKVELNIEMKSQKISGKSYLDYFEEPIWQNTSNPLSLTIKLKSEAYETWFEPSFWDEQKVSLILTLNPMVLFNINTTIYEEGNVNIEVPGGININNVNINLNQGKIIYNFVFCTIIGNITGFIGSGDIELKANNVKFTQNNMWDISNNDGLITFKIIQGTVMNANLTGIGKTKTGQIKIEYVDFSPTIGAMFTFHNHSGFWWNNIYNNWVGFPEEPESFTDLPDAGYIFTSLDFITAKFNYNISLYRDFVTRIFPYIVNLSSIPFS